MDGVEKIDEFEFEDFEASQRDFLDNDQEEDGQKLGFTNEDCVESNDFDDQENSESV